MRLPMVDCRSLLEFCRAFEQHQNSNSKKPNSPLNPPASSSSPCQNHSPSAAFDVLLLLVVLFSLGFLIIPYSFTIIRHLLPLISHLIAAAPLPYFAGLLFALLGGIVAWEVIDQRCRRCGNPHCRGLRKAVEFDIQLESEECLKYLKAPNFGNYKVKPLELGEDRVHRELEAELRRMAPPNGRTVLIFRTSCGCPAARLEVWGNKKIRRIKK